MFVDVRYCGFTVVTGSWSCLQAVNTRGVWLWTTWPATDPTCHFHPTEHPSHLNHSLTKVAAQPTCWKLPPPPSGRRRAAVGSRRHRRRHQLIVPVRDRGSGSAGSWSTVVVGGGGEGDGRAVMWAAREGVKLWTGGKMDKAVAAAAVMNRSGEPKRPESRLVYPLFPFIWSPITKV